MLRKGFVFFCCQCAVLGMNIAGAERTAAVCLLFQQFPLMHEEYSSVSTISSWAHIMGHIRAHTALLSQLGPSWKHQEHSSTRCRWPRQSDCRVCLCVYYALWTMKITVLIVIGITATHKHTPFSLFHNFLSTQWTQSQSTLDGKPEGALIYCTLSTGMFNVTQWHFCGIICWFDFIFFLLFHTLCVVQVYKPNNVHSPVLLENTSFFGWHLPFFHHSILTLFRTHIVPFYVCINCKHSSIQVYFINKFRCLFIFRRRELTKANHCASEGDAPNHIALSVCAVRISTTTNMTIFWNYVNFQWES